MTIELTSEDSLRLNVLAANADAIRINENTMEIVGLHGDQEMHVQLHPTGSSDRYLKEVRELLASLVLDSPGGYPVFINRWARMGQIQSDRLDCLLKIGNPDAVMAAVSSPGMNDQLARLAWWCEPQAEYARKLLSHSEVAMGQMGPVLAEHLAEHLPFETESQSVIETVRLVLQPGLIDETLKSRLWRRGESNKSYRVGFLLDASADIPEKQLQHQCSPEVEDSLGSLIESGNPYASLLRKLLASEGQTFSHAVIDIMRRPADQDVVSAAFRSVGYYFSEARNQTGQLRTLDEVRIAAMQSREQGDLALEQLISTLPGLQTEIGAMLFLAHVDEALLIPIFGATDAVGSVMRKKIAPISDPVTEMLKSLLGAK